MSKLLYIQTSPRGERSVSNTVAEAFLKSYQNTHPQEQIETLNLFVEKLPSFDGLTIQAKYTILHGQTHTQLEVDAWREVEKIIEKFTSADKYLLSLPMWNFGIPYRLKHYIDIIVQPGYTFSYNPKNGYKGLITGKPLLAIYARGGAYGPGTGGEDADMQKKYIELIFGFIGFTDIQSIIVEPTLQGGPDIAQVKIKEASQNAAEIAAKF